MMKVKKILEVVVGSTTHGITSQDKLEDLDLMAVVLETPVQAFGFYPEDTWTERTKPEGVRSEAGDIDRVTYSLRKFLILALNNNPTILLAFFVQPPFVREITDEGHALRALASSIVCKEAFPKFRGYMQQQHERLLGLRGQRNITRPELVEKYGYDTKYASHIIRLGMQGAELLRTGRLTLPMKPHEREFVTAVRNGRFSLAQISDHILQVEKSLVLAYNESKLPEKPNRVVVQNFMLCTYLEHFSQCYAKMLHA